MAAALAAKVLPFALFETRRLVGALVGIVGLDRDMADRPPPRRAGRRTDRARAARDLPALLRPHVHQCQGCALRGRDGGPVARDGARVRRISAARRAHGRLVGVGIGLAFGSRILAGIARALRARRLLLIVIDGRARGRPARERRPRLGEFVWRLLPALALGYLIMGLLWPWSILAPLNPLTGGRIFRHLLRKALARTVCRQAVSR